jgi:hypothetical protein
VACSEESVKAIFNGVEQILRLHRAILFDFKKEEVHPALVRACVCWLVGCVASDLI